MKEQTAEEGNAKYKIGNKWNELKNSKQNRGSILAFQGKGSQAEEGEIHLYFPLRKYYLHTALSWSCTD